MSRWLIWSIEHTAWWGPGQMGYVPTLDGAGYYDEVEADRIVAQANRVKVNECKVPVDAVGFTSGRSISSVEDAS
jgi:hypothetical protein